MIIALDVEGTLVSNAVSQFPRPGLKRFLEACRSRASRVVVFTTVPEPRFRSMVQGMVARGEVPGWFAEVDYVQWHGPHKRIHFIDGSEETPALLVDDMERYIHPDDREHWVAVEPYEAPYPDDDRALDAALDRLRSHIRERTR